MNSYLTFFLQILLMKKQKRLRNNLNFRKRTFFTKLIHKNFLAQFWPKYLKSQVQAIIKRDTKRFGNL